MSDLVLRPLEADELALFNSYPNEPTSGVGVRRRTFDEELAAGQYRPEWTWVALRDGGDVVARVAFWAPAGAPHPFSLDRFDPGAGPDGIDIGADLLRAAYAALAGPDYSAPSNPYGGRPDYHLFLPADWRDRPDAFADATDRVTAAERAGLRFFVERLNLRWTAADGPPPARPGRLRFEPATEEHHDLVVDVLSRLSTGSLDAYDRVEVERHGLRRAAEATVAEVAEMGGPGRDWWRLAYLGEDPVGIVMPTRNATSATIGYVGVVPEHRGNRYSDDLVIEALHTFTGAGQTEVNDATDVGNAPMAASFARVGYRVTGRRIVLT